MDDLQKLNNLKLKVGSADDEDNLLRLYLADAKQAILGKLYPMALGDYPELPTKYDAIQIDIAVYLYSKRGAEGQTAHSENGISRAYESAYIPPSMLDNIIPYGSVI